MLPFIINNAAVLQFFVCQPLNVSVVGKRMKSKTVLTKVKLTKYANRSGAHQAIFRWYGKIPYKNKFVSLANQIKPSQPTPKLHHTILLPYQPGLSGQPVHSSKIYDSIPNQSVSQEANKKRKFSYRLIFKLWRNH